MNRLAPAPVRFGRLYVVAASGCWEWQGHRQRNGYGRFWLAGRLEWAHRAAWRLHVGPIPDGMLVLHRCDNRPCVNPAHLRLGTAAENSADMVAKNRSQRGAANSQARLTADEVAAIRADDRPSRVIASVFGISRDYVTELKRGDRWRVPIEPPAPRVAPAPALPSGRTPARRERSEALT